MSSNYKSAGVDIDAGDEVVKKIKNFAKSTFNKNVLSDIGLFGAFYKPRSLHHLGIIDFVQVIGAFCW